MADQLRSLAVTVEEPRAGDFVWVLGERAGESWQTLKRGRAPQATYREAMAAGLLVLQGMVDDLDIGPRVETGQEDAAAPAEPDASRKDPAVAGRKRLFGFGPLV
jgi:hypothetical protein